MTKIADVVICGAGIAGVATAYHLAVRHGVKDILLVDERPALSLTSDKSTEAYRNWWPGPGDAMVSMMNRSIDLLEGFAHESGNIFHLNRRGYLYVTLTAEGIQDLEAFAVEASTLGAGPLRIHNSKTGGEVYQPSPAVGFEGLPGGADFIHDKQLIWEHFPYLSTEVLAVLHVRRAGWLSAQQLGAYLLEQARKYGVELVEDRVLRVQVKGGKVKNVELASGPVVSTPVFVNAAGPFLSQVGEFIDVDIPVYNELHMKAAFDDHRGVISRDAPMVISADEETLEWTEVERELISEDEDSHWLTSRLPSGAHFRPEGGPDAQTLLTLWDVQEKAVEPVVPPQLDPMYPEIALRGLCKMVPDLKEYLKRLPKAYLDGGYYTRTRENRPLACPLPLEGAFVIGAMAGYGIMASAALGELVAKHITTDELPDYASTFDLQRYSDPEYQLLLDNWGSTWQL
ncbi:MAG: FAD-binding oxidoreductase [Chloroflexi bacterium]|nr:FAD-binding oxidoreductase [Chloroflexota bacterium]